MSYHLQPMEADRLKHHPIASTGCSGPLSAGVQEIWCFKKKKLAKKGNILIETVFILLYIGLVGRF